MGDISHFENGHLPAPPPPPLRPLSGSEVSLCDAMWREETLVSRSILNLNLNSENFHLLECCSTSHLPSTQGLPGRGWMAHDRIYALSVPWKGGRAREQTLYARLPLPALSPPYQKINLINAGFEKCDSEYTSSNFYSGGSGRSIRGISRSPIQIVFSLLTLNLSGHCLKMILWIKLGHVLI